MAPIYRVRITPRAESDLERIFKFIEQDSPQNARQMIKELIDAIDSLELFPHRYNVPRGSKGKRRDIRSMPVWPYLIRYRIDERRSAVHVMRIRHGARKNP